MAKKVPQEQVQAGGSRDFTLVTKYPYGYRSREDITNLPPSVLVRGSQNVVTNTAGRISVTQGYTLDGQSSLVVAPILAAYDWQTHFGPIRHLRAGFLTSAGNDGKLQVRYVDSTGTITWVDLMTALTSVSFNFTSWWFATSTRLVLLFVDGSTNLYEWTGGMTTFASATANTITKQGATTWAEEGFYTTPDGTRAVLINGTPYTYTGGEGTTTITGVAPDPSIPGYAVGTLIMQQVRTTAGGSITGVPATYKKNIIGTARNQVYLGSFTNASVYISRTDSSTNYAFTSPVRLVGEGALITLDGPGSTFVVQEDTMYVAGKPNFWYQINFQLDATNAAEQISIHSLKTATLQAPQSQALTDNSGDNVVFVSNEPIVQRLGRVDNVVLTPQLSDLSYSIVDDMNVYDFTDGAVKYHRKYNYVAVPKENLIRVYNMTDPNNQYWEAPLTFPFSRFSVIDGELYGHGYGVSETYKMFQGYNFNGHPIDAKAVFSYQNFGTRTTFKGFDEFYTEGYVSQNTNPLTLGLTYEIDGCAVTTVYDLDGNNDQFVCVPGNLNSLGKFPLGNQPLGSSSNPGGVLPPKFKWIKTFPNFYFREVQVSYSSVGIDYHWELLAFGPKLLDTSQLNNDIMD